MKITQKDVKKNIVNICDVEGGIIIKYKENYYLTAHADYDETDEVCLINLENGMLEYISLGEDVELVDYEFNVFN